MIQVRDRRFSAVLFRVVNANRSNLATARLICSLSQVGKPQDGQVSLPSSLLINFIQQFMEISLLLFAATTPNLGLSFFDYGIAVGVILCLFFIVWFGGRHVLDKFEKISQHHDETIKAIAEQHREGRKEWRNEANDRVAHINELLEKTLNSLGK